MRDTLRVRQVLATSRKSTGGSFTDLVAAMGAPRSNSTGRRKVGTAVQRVQDSGVGCSPIRLATNRFQIDSSSSDSEKHSVAVTSSPSKGMLDLSDRARHRNNFID